MPIFKINDKNILFVHIPRTGGTFIEKWLQQNGRMSFYSNLVPAYMKITPQHFTYDNVRALLSESLCFDFIFTIIRDPVDRFESEYFWRTQESKKNFLRRPDFNDWAVLHLTKYRINPFHLDNHLRPQHDYLGDDIFIYNYEDGMNFICDDIREKIGIERPENINIVNSGREESETIVWGHESERIFQEVYSADLIKG